MRHNKINRNITVQIVDDDRLNLMVLEKVLNDQGFKTIQAVDGYECLELLKKNRPDILLLDIMMPHLSGIDVCKTIRKTPELSSIPIIFITAATDDKTLRNAFEAGGNDYVKKPIHNLELIKRIEAALNHQELLQKKERRRKASGNPINEWNNIPSVKSTASGPLRYDTDFADGPGQRNKIIRNSAENATADSAYNRINKQDEQYQRSENTRVHRQLENNRYR